MKVVVLQLVSQIYILDGFLISDLFPDTLPAAPDDICNTRLFGQLLIIRHLISN